MYPHRSRSYLLAPARLALLVALSICPLAAQASAPIHADLNGSGSVDIIDAQCAIVHVLATLTGGPPPECLQGGPTVGSDVDCGGSISVPDILLTISAALGESLGPAIDSDADGKIDACTDGGCCSATQGGPGCGDGVCEACVCAADPYCCSNGWDEVCTMRAQLACEGECGCSAPAPAPDCSNFDAFVRTLWTAELGVDNQQGRTVGYAIEQPLPAGTVIKESDGAYATSLSSAQYFAYLDDAPGAFFEHSVRYVSCDVATGTLFVVRDVAWPALVDGAFPAEWQDAGHLVHLLRPTTLPPGPEASGGASSLWPIAEFGDAPDGGSGHYPTRFDTNNAAVPGMPGGHALDADEEWIGSTATEERGATDPFDPDGTRNLDNRDLDDPKYLVIPDAGDGSVARLLFFASVADSAPGGARYVNLLLDRDFDGDWYDPTLDEWVLENEAIKTVRPGQRRAWLTADFAFVDATGAPLRTAWFRVALLRSPIDATAYPFGQWDGAGAFARGEIEDEFFDFEPFAPPEELFEEPPPPPGGGGCPLEFKWGYVRLKHAIIVNGGDHPGDRFVERSAAAMANHLHQSCYDTTYVDSLAGLNQAVADLVPQLLCLDEVFIYVVAHGSEKAAQMRVGGAKVSQAQLVAALAPLVPCDGEDCLTSDKICDVKLAVESCYAGNFSGLDLTGRTVTLSSNATQPSWISCGTGRGRLADAIINGLHGFPADIQTAMDADALVCGSKKQTMKQTGGPCDCECPLVVEDGACCLAESGMCLVLTPEACESKGGAYLGDGTVCLGDNNGDGYDDACPGEGFASDCCEPKLEPGCSDFACVEAICSADPFCCETQWDSICADAAVEICECEGVVPPDEPTYCCDPEMVGACMEVNPACAELLCSVDVQCCGPSAAPFCAEIAFEFPQCGCL